jgi:glycosyltransferase involved in cell wall biosynthesis
VGAIPEVIDDERGLLVEPRDADALADALAELIADPDRVATMGEANRRAATDEYAWETVAEELLATYDRNLAAEAL